MSFILKRNHRSSHGLSDFQEQQTRTKAIQQCRISELSSISACYNETCSFNNNLYHGLSIAIIDQPICHTIAQRMAFPKKKIFSDKKIASHRDTLVLHLGLVNKGNSTTGFWYGDLSALKCLQEFICGYNKLPLVWLNLLY